MEENSSGALIAFKLLLIPIALFLRCYTIQKLWLWFAVPALGVKPIGLALAYGVGLLGSYITYQFPTDMGDPESDHSANVRLAATILMPLMILGLGWVASHFM